MIIVDRKEVSKLLISPELLTEKDIRKGRFVAYYSKDERFHLMRISWLGLDFVTLSPVLQNSLQRRFNISKKDFTKQCYHFIATNEDETLKAEVFITQYSWRHLLKDYEDDSLVTAEIITKKFSCRCIDKCEKQKGVCEYPSGIYPVPCPESFTFALEARIIPMKDIASNMALSVLSRLNNEIVEMLKLKGVGEKEIGVVHGYLFEQDIKLNEKLEEN